jgi:hypothetical protein
MTIRAPGTMHHGVLYLTGDITYAEGTHGIVIHDFVGTVNLYHLTSYNSEAAVADAGDGDAIYLGTSATVVMRNCGIVGSKLGIYIPGGGAPTLDLDYLGFYDNTANYTNVDPGDQAAHVVTADPLLVNPAAGDLELQALSPWRDAGVNIPGISEQVSTEIGRYEYA